MPAPKLAVTIWKKLFSGKAMSKRTSSHRTESLFQQLLGAFCGHNLIRATPPTCIIDLVIPFVRRLKFQNVVLRRARFTPNPSPKRKLCADEGFSFLQGGSFQ
ncbi:hypothetical protein OCU04_002968 [Sclerotinia nivalis]|uniref:Uncharacterized protein n=1 Tax=Sclerotinia nivalis TaxID=352851 RepID=A0A9X0AVE8_9HELO|nr:hypothetical protein OCU04_002968 [Sclerotinia nivalis]